MKNGLATLYYIHDPMCSWCWGYRPTWLKLKSALSQDCVVLNVLGGLAADSDDPMPEQLRSGIEATWRNIQARLGTRFNYEFWRRCEPRRDTYKACRAVLVAALNGLEEDMIVAIQRAYYLHAQNPSDVDTLVDLAVDLGMDGDGFRIALESEETENRFRQQRLLAAKLGADGFPSLRLVTEDKLYPVTLDYQNHSVSLNQIKALTRTS